MVPNFQVAAVGPRNWLTFQIISTLSNELWNQILPSLSQAFTTFFTVILSLTEGRAGIAWVPSNKMLFLPPSEGYRYRGRAACDRCPVSC
jgi:hypothetical protein